jgi:glycosyltransferase involved in cell wall biosynthesis
MDEKILSVCLITYNHVNYIRQAIEGVLMQKVNFSWELIIADDFSTDGTREILQEYKDAYPDFITLILQEKNVGAAQNWLDLLYYPKSKYIAYFEGDDYWTDPLKLQKQVDFLEKNDDYSLVYTKVNCQRQEDIKRIKKKTFGGPFTSFNDLLLVNTIPTPTVVLKVEDLKIYLREIYPYTKSCLMGDYPLWLWISFWKKIFFIDEVTAVYRIMPNSLSHSSSIDIREKFIDSDFEMRDFFIKKYSPAQKEKINNIKFLCLAHNAIAHNDRKKAITYYRMVKNLCVKEKIKYNMCRNMISYFVLKKIINI